jgi:hypothetical protein
VLKNRLKHKGTKITKRSPHAKLAKVATEKHNEIDENVDYL